MKMAMFDASSKGVQFLGLRDRVARFARDEEGSLIILSLQIFLIMLITTGIAIDFSRQEERRELIQNTIDRAVLAAAALSQTLDPKDVVKDYLSKAGLGSVEVDPQVLQGKNLEWRRVTVSVRDTMPTIFGPLVGIKQLSANGDSQAEESIGNVEISMVLDVSGSMNDAVKDDPDCSYRCSASKSRLDHLKDASKAFVDKMFQSVQPEDAPAGRLSISVVPYSSNVYLGTDMQKAYTLSDDYTIINSSFWEAQCADFDADDMAQIEIDGSQTLTRTMYGASGDIGDTVSESSWYNYTTNPLNETWNNCFNFTQNKLVPLGNNRTYLLGTAYPQTPTSESQKGYFDKLTALGGTATDIGAKWGLALLDPSAQDEMSKITSISTDLVDRPIAYDGDTMKVMVLMSDGANSTSYSTLPGYRHGPSGIMSIHGVNELNGMAPNSTQKTGMYFHKPDRGSKPYYSYKDKTWVARSEITKTETQYETQTGTCSQYKSGWSWYWNSCSIGTAYCTTLVSQTSSTRNYSCSKTTSKQVEVQAPLYDVTFEYLYQTKKWNLYAVADLLRAPFGRSTHAQYDVMALQSENILGKGLTDKDDRLDALCTKAKKNGVIIFTVSADPQTSHEVDVLRKCASADTYAYSVTGGNLATAFSSIASAITALRLTN